MSELQQAINEMRNMRESYDQLSAAAEAYNVGKTELAEAITSKGVPTSASETIPQMAKKVAAISQETYEINGGEMYAKQLFGSLVAPNYWNLYDVLAQLLSDGRLVQYGGILLAEYYRGYDSLALAGAGAGGAYVVSDKDENGNFIKYETDIVHTWNTEFDGKGNRWVAYCFAEEYHDFQITDTNTSPRSIFIGRKVGTITSLVTGRASEIVVPDGNELNRFSCNGFSQNFGRSIVLKENEALYNDLILPTATESIYLKCRRINGASGIVIKLINASALKSAIIEARESITSQDYNRPFIYYGDGRGDLPLLFIKTPVINGYITNMAHIRELVLQVERIGGGTYGTFGNVPTIDRVFFKYITNDKTKSISYFDGVYRSNLTGTTDVELQEGWCKPINLSKIPNLSKETVQAHIFDRLGVNDLSTGAVTITLATAVLNLFTQEEIDAVVARTNITIVGA